MFKKDITIANFVSLDIISSGCTVFSVVYFSYNQPPKQWRTSRNPKKCSRVQTGKSCRKSSCTGRMVASRSHCGSGTPRSTWSKRRFGTRSHHTSTRCVFCYYSGHSEICAYKWISALILKGYSKAIQSRISDLLFFP